MKTCSRCGLERKKSSFNKKKVAPDGLRSECNLCQSLDYDERKAKGKVKNCSVGYKSFKVKYGVAYTTIRDWLIREYDKGNVEYYQLKQVPKNERRKLVNKYKKSKES